MKQLILPNIPLTERKPIQLIKYMGSKRGILNFVIPVIESVTPPGAPVIDLFAGTHSVGYALAGNHPIYANDIQQYSAAMGKSLLSQTVELLHPDAIWQELEPIVLSNRKQLEAIFRVSLATEDLLLNPKRFDEKSLNAYKEFQQSFPYAGNLERGDIAAQKGVQTLVADGRKAHGNKPWGLITAYYNNAYFSLRQCIDIDSIRLAISERLDVQSHVHHVAMACLLHACGYCTPSPGHFAQYRQLNSVAVFEDIARYRRRDVREYFLKKFGEFHRHLAPAQYACDVASSHHLTYLDQLDLQGSASKPVTVYADPPYSFVHYSRFYHVLETLVKYDYPRCDFFGRYRDDRYQSKFCQHAKAIDEFKALVAAVHKKKMNLVLSYADTALVPLDTLMTVCQTAYKSKNVKAEFSNHLHATMGRNGDKTRAVEETAIVCRYKWPR